ncbi:Hypothetical predicted protein, partial [Paramuricea clavata]
MASGRVLLSNHRSLQRAFKRQLLKFCASQAHRSTRERRFGRTGESCKHVSGYYADGLSATDSGRRLTVSAEH